MQEMFKVRPELESISCPDRHDTICMEKMRFISAEREVKRLTNIKREYERAFDSLLSTISSLLEPTSPIFNLFVDKVAQVPRVEQVYAFIEEEVIDIWTIIEKSDFDVEEKIIEAQCELMRVFQDINFDFMILPRYGRDLKQLLPSGGKLVHPPTE